MDILLSLHFDTLLDFAIGEIMSGLPEEQRAEFLRRLPTGGADPDDETFTEIVREDGQVIRITEARRKQMERNRRGMLMRPRKGQMIKR